MIRPRRRFGLRHHCIASWPSMSAATGTASLRPGCRLDELLVKAGVRSRLGGCSETAQRQGSRRLLFLFSYPSLPQALGSLRFPITS
uniref:Uncharacterized protein n=1 Tax=Chromera velia CCMP2878 TaxID=1169474 RepID=A0A0G4HP21_9ALVE|eukprot:Cvel_1206.t1-p1 / transcript=Cvel_1206.t1 / gene=Cvel_1206 / organism=Chromera_velia_CCMP2878 / gene_product=hypothetical protein / transcript_product=hypothetical protein / location=Cvel_scaffold40:43448-44101(-) / protein_length=86 / sequence_SO=supercontig / SO=protein_coding / is_pseudo=false